MNPWPLIVALIAQLPAPTIEPPATPPAPTPSPAATAPPTTLSADPLTKDFGIVYDVPQIWEWRVKNTGTAPLYVVAPGCDCKKTGFVVPKDPISPGASGAVQFTLNPRMRDYGPGSRMLSLETNDPAHPAFIINATWDYEPLVICSPPVARFSDIAAGLPADAYITILSRDPSFAVEKVEASSPLITAVRTDDNIPSSMPHYPGRAVYKLHLSPGAPTGPLESVLTVTATARRTPELPVESIIVDATITANVRSALLLKPRAFRAASAIVGQTVESDIRISLPGNAPFNITKAVITESGVEGLSIRSEPWPEGGHRLILSGPAGETPGLFKGTAEITTDVPHESPLSIPFSVIVSPAPGATGAGATPGH